MPLSSLFHALVSDIEPIWSARVAFTPSIAREMVGFVWAIARHVQEVSATA